MSKSEDTEHQTNSVVTRMAPSPTGPFHVGGVRTLLFNYFFARQQGGKFILRSEDTDEERSRPEYEEGIMEALEWLGLRYDEFFRQSEQVSRHQNAIQDLIAKDHAYEAEESESGKGKVIRFRNPGAEITIHDLILGDVTFNTSDLGDFVIARNSHSPLYHLAVVLDDHDEGVTHVIRAQEHLPNTPRQLLLIRALGLREPIYAHVPFILGPDGKKKLSKRDGDVAILDYRDKGYLPEAMINFLAFIGWNPGGEEEVFSSSELIEKFNLEQVQKGPAGFNVEKLRWLNREHLQRLSDEVFLDKVKPFLGKLADKDISKILPIIRERTYVFGELGECIAAGEYDYFFAAPIYPNPEKIIWKKSDRSTTIKHLEWLRDRLSAHEEDFIEKEVEVLIFPYAEEQGKGDVLWPLRFALSGCERSPGPFTLLSVLGKEESLHRITQAITALSQKTA